MAKFLLGQLCSTPGCLDAFVRCGVSPLAYISRHVRGDWGECDAADSAANDAAVIEGLRVFSVYRLPDGTRIWIITEADRSYTTLLLPEEY
jgi:hypothetical protein